jgi:SagB-type dehydrogenase family enzyme
VLATRRSSRSFGPRALDNRELGQLLWAAQGSTGNHRTAPSAGALYPLTVQVVDAHGIWRYDATEHALTREATNDRREALAAAALRQSSIRGAPVTLVISAELAITARKYGARTGERFATLEAGHVAQNVLLSATALGLAAVPIGGFEDQAVREVLSLPADVTPLYLILVGAPHE